MGRSLRSSPGDPGHLKGFGLDEGMPDLWSTSSRVQLQVSRPWPQEYESKHQNLLAQQEGLQGAWRNVVVVFLLLVHCEQGAFLLQPGEEPPEDRNGAVALVSFNRGDGAVHGIPCLFSRDNPFLTPVLLSAARSNSTRSTSVTSLSTDDHPLVSYPR
ncbi:hypothetical protein V8E54_009310 [Elaphomyces granulatus]